MAWAIIAAASSLGSMNSIIYTCSRGRLGSWTPEAPNSALLTFWVLVFVVKQSIGEANVLPWSRFWSYVHVAMKPQQQRGSNHLAAAAALDGAGIDEKDSRPSISQVSPRGGLALHWLMTTVMMIIIGNLPPTEGSVSLSGILQTYGHTLVLGKMRRCSSCPAFWIFPRIDRLTLARVLAVVGFLWFRLSSREEALGRTTPNDTSWFRLSKQTGLPWVVLISVGVFGYACFNVAVLVLAPMNYLLPSKKKDPTDSQGLSVHSRGWLLPVVVGSLVLFSFVYFVLVFGAADTWYYDFPERYRGREEDRDQWKVRWKNGFAFPSLQPPAEGLLKGEIFNLIPSTGPWKYLNLPRLAGIKVEIEKEAALSGHSLELERAQSYGNRCRTKFLPLKYKVCLSPFFPTTSMPCQLLRSQTNGFMLAWCIKRLPQRRRK